MSLLEYNEVTEKKFIVMDGAPYEVITAHVFRKQQRKPVNATKLKNLMTGKVTEYSFHVSEKVEEAEIDTKEVKYLYNNKGEWWFCETSDPSKRFKVTEEQVGSQARFIKGNTIVDQCSSGNSRWASNSRSSSSFESPTRRRPSRRHGHRRTESHHARDWRYDKRAFVRE